jgi:CBS domain-containing protein
MTKEVKTIEETKTLSDALKMMRDSKVGSLVVVGKDKTPLGIFTERDLVKKMAEQGQAALALPMAQLMSKPLTIISPTATIWDAITLMGRVDIRRLPVVEGGRLVGILTERDIFRLILAQQNMLLESVSESFPAATREQLREMAGHMGLSTPPGRASEN